MSGFKGWLHFRFLLYLVFVLTIICFLFSFSIGFANTQPQINNAINGQTLSTQFPVFHWSSIDGAGGYGIELLDAPPELGEENGTVASIHRIAVGITTGTSWYGDIRGLSAGTYYYRIIALSGQGLVGVFSDTDSFTVPKPVIQSPFSGAQLMTPFPDFSWSAVAGATSYGIELLNGPPENPNSTQASAARITVGITSETSWDGDVRGLATGTYYYRIIAWNQYGFMGGFSDHDSFTIAKPTMQPVDLTDLANPIFSWNAINGADSYLLEILSQSPESPNNAALSMYGVYNTETAGQSLQMSTRHLVARQYYVRVMAKKNGENLGVFSDTVTFSVDPSVVIIPTLTSNLAGQMLTDQFPVFSWDPVAGATGYGIELLSNTPENPGSNEPSMYRIAAAPTPDQSWTGDTRGLPAGTFYYRVIAFDGGGLVGGFSDPDSFSLPKPSLAPVQWADHLTPIFDWSSVNGATAYGLALLSNEPENPNGATPSTYRLSAGPTTDTQWNGSTISLNGGTYYVRVIAANDNGVLGGFSDTESFEVVRPNLGSIAWAGLNTPYFYWSAVQGATFYGIELLRAMPENPNGTTASVYRMGAATTTSTMFAGDTSGFAPGTYYWRVIAYNESGLVGDFSNTGSFFYMPQGPKSIDVNLSTQTVTAVIAGFHYKSFSTSTGMSGWETPTGNYAIGEKILSMDMSGDDYYVSNVPYCMHVVRGVYIHGCYWHNNFGTPVSHGCINLPVGDAAWLYDWTPSGTPVYIHY